MPVKPDQSFSPDVAKILDQVRAGICRYIWIEGLSVALIWICLTFWLALAIDYLPVLAGMNEMPWQARVVVLAIIASVLAWIAWRWILRRAFVRFKDISVALLLERRHNELNDRLVTALEASPESMNEYSRLMVANTQAEVEQQIRDIQSTDVFNWRPLLRSATIAGLLVLSVGVFAIAKNDAFTLGAKRLYLLDQEQWPRRCMIELVGARVKRNNPVQGIEQIGEIQTFNGNVLKVATGASLTLYVRAETEQESTSEPNETDRAAPDVCTIRYWTNDGQRGTQSMKKIGSPKNGYQQYLLDTKPFAGMLNDLQFDIRGGDHRIGPFTVEVVDEPAVIETMVETEFPKYLKRSDWTGQAARSWYQGMEVTIGTSVNITATTSKDLSKVYALDPATKTLNSIEPDDTNSFRFDFGILRESETIEFYLQDKDGIITELPHRITIAAIKDEPPKINTVLKGIGTAVTPNVQIPLDGFIKDDNAVERAWLQIETVIPGKEQIEQEFPIGVGGKVDAAYDFQEKRKLDDDPFTLPVGPDYPISVTVKAKDAYDLGPDNVGVGDRYELEVVTDNQLLKILERDEVDQRRRLQQIADEMKDARQYLVRSRSDRSGLSGAREPGDEAVEPGDEQSQQDLAQRQEFRLLFSQRAILQVEKSQMEIGVVADAFRHIRLQLINNRVDNQIRKTRLEKEIIDPLEEIRVSEMDQLTQSIKNAEKELLVLQQNPADELVSQQANELSNVAIEQIDVVLARIDAVLSILVKYETQNQLLDIVRQMIKDQEALIQRTKQERERKAFDSLLD